LRSTMLVAGPAIDLMSSVEPTARKRPSRTATALATLNEASAVMNLPLMKMASGCPDGTLSLARKLADLESRELILHSRHRRQLCSPIEQSFVITQFVSVQNLIVKGGIDCGFAN
jgi:hypothetical protein